MEPEITRVENDAKQPRESSRASDESSGPRDSSIAPNDVVFGRGALANNHRGNILFRRIVNHNKSAYQETENATRKQLLVTSIIMSIQRIGGRFLRKGDDGSWWVEAKMKQVRRKTAQALREPDVESTGPQAASNLESVALAEQSAGIQDDNEMNESTTRSSFIDVRKTEPAPHFLNNERTEMEPKKTATSSRQAVDEPTTTMQVVEASHLSDEGRINRIRINATPRRKMLAQQNVLLDRAQSSAEEQPNIKSPSRLEDHAPQSEATFSSELAMTDHFHSVCAPPRHSSPPDADHPTMAVTVDPPITSPAAFHVAGQVSPDVELFPKDLLDRVLGAEDSPDRFSRRRHRHDHPYPNDYSNSTNAQLSPVFLLCKCDIWI